MILIDTSVWIDHLRSGNQRLKELLLDEVVLTHHFILVNSLVGIYKIASAFLKHLLRYHQQYQQGRTKCCA